MIINQGKFGKTQSDWSAIRPGCNECLLQTRKKHPIIQVDNFKRLFAQKTRSLQPGRIALQSAPRI